MTLLEKIHAARDAKDLKLLEMEIFLDMPHFKENYGAFIQRNKELNHN